MIAGFDLGMTTGFCYADELEPVFGVWKLEKAYSGDEHGRPFTDFQNKLKDLHEKFKITGIGYENVTFSTGPGQTQVYFGLRGLLLAFAYENNIPCLGVHVATLKKWFTGSGRAGKDDMVRKANELYDAKLLHPDIEKTSGDVADGIAIWDWARNQRLFKNAN